jgi:hypothetical protein
MHSEAGFVRPPTVAARFGDGAQTGQKEDEKEKKNSFDGHFGMWSGHNLTAPSVISYCAVAV